MKFTSNQIGIIAMAVLTGFIHLVLLNMMMGKLDVMFTLNGLGYFALLAAFFLQLPILKEYRNPIRWAFIAYTVATIVAWIILGNKTFPAGLLGYFTKLVELFLIYFLFREK